MENAKSMEQLAKKTEVEAFIKAYVESYVLNPSMTPQMIYESVLASLAIKFESRAYAPPLKADIKGIVRRLRNSDVPDIEKIHQAPLCNTVNGLQFFKGKFEIAVRNSFVTCFFWASTEGINLLKQSDHIFIDCTFKSVPKPSKQLLIIMGHHRYTHVYFPGIFVMMDSKNEEAYELVLFIVKLWMGADFLPEKITSDFEIGLINAISKVFPSVEIIGCYFHYKQAMKRKLKDLGCSDSDLQFILNLTSLLTVIYLDEFGQAFNYIEEILSEKNVNLLDIFEKFKDYINIYWAPKFNYWNISRFPATLIPNLKRTNNCLERYNRRLNSKFPNAHPSIVQLVSTLKDEESYYSQYIRSIQTGIQYLEEPEEYFHPSCDEFREFF